MKTTLIIIWLLIGTISVWRTYFGIQKDWYNRFGTTMNEDEEADSHKLLLKLSPILILGGLITFIIYASILPQAWWFKAPKK